MANKETNLQEKVYCERCRGTTNHNLLSSVRIDGTEEIPGAANTISWFDKYEVLQCAGCDRIVFRRRNWFSEYQDDWWEGAKPVYRDSYYPAELEDLEAQNDDAVEDGEGGTVKTTGDDGIRVFISYSQDSDEHKKKALDFAQQLRDDGIGCSIDQFINGSPEEGWPAWMERQVDEAEYVLVVCTGTYHRRYRGDEKPGKGTGAKWEAVLTRQELYEGEGRNEKFIPVFFDGASEEDIPKPLRPYTRYHLPGGYEKLYRYITNQPKVVPQKIGQIRRMESVDISDQLDSEESTARSAEMNQSDALEKYRTDTFDPISEYYDVFLQNDFPYGKKFRLTFDDGTSVEGIPTAGSIFNPTDPNASFRLSAGGKAYRVPFRKLISAVALEAESTQKDSPRELLLEILCEFADKAGNVQIREVELHARLGSVAKDWDIHALMIRLKDEGAFLGKPYFESGPQGAVFVVRLRDY